MPTTMHDTEKALQEIWDAAVRLGLDPFPTHFEVVPANIMYELGAYGIPGRFSHWTHGKAYWHMKTMYDYGLSKVYELVINTNPSLLPGQGRPTTCGTWTRHPGRTRTTASRDASRPRRS